MQDAIDDPTHICRPNKDFGKGSYLTTLKDQAQKMEKWGAAIYDGELIVNIYQFNSINLQNPLMNIRLNGLCS